MDIVPGFCTMYNIGGCRLVPPFHHPPVPPPPALFPARACSLSGQTTAPPALPVSHTSPMLAQSARSRKLARLVLATRVQSRPQAF